MFLDNDIEILPGAVEHLLDILETQSHVTAAGMTLVFPNGQIHLSGADFWVENDVLNYSLFGFGHYFDDGSLHKSGNCCWLNGGSTLFRRDVFDREPLDARMRAHYDDLEWCYRSKQSNALTFYRCTEALALHHHQFKTPTKDEPREQARQRAADFIETIAYFYQKHGKVIQNLFDFVPELGVPSNPMSVSAARVLLELVNARGVDWFVEKWNDQRWEALFASVRLSTQVESLFAQVAERQQAVETLTAQLAAQTEKVNMPVAQVGERQHAVEGLTAELGAIHASKFWKLVSLWRSLLRRLR